MGLDERWPYLLVREKIELARCIFGVRHLKRQRVTLGVREHRQAVVVGRCCDTPGRKAWKGMGSIVLLLMALRVPVARRSVHVAMHFSYFW